MSQPLARHHPRLRARPRRHRQAGRRIPAGHPGRRGRPPRRAARPHQARSRPRMKLAGTGVTVEVRPGDNLMIHAAMAMAKPGDVLVIDGKGDQTSALMGTIMMTACRAARHRRRRDRRRRARQPGDRRDGLSRCSRSAPTRTARPRTCRGRIGHPVSVGGVTVHAGRLRDRRRRRRDRGRAREDRSRCCRCAAKKVAGRDRAHRRHQGTATRRADVARRAPCAPPAC